MPSIPWVVHFRIGLFVSDSLLVLLDDWARQIVGRPVVPVGFMNVGLGQVDVEALDIQGGVAHDYLQGKWAAIWRGLDNQVRWEYLTF